jgi:hypothetical protein
MLNIDIGMLSQPMRINTCSKLLRVIKIINYFVHIALGGMIILGVSLRQLTLASVKHCISPGCKLTDVFFNLVYTELSVFSQCTYPSMSLSAPSAYPD